MILSAYLAAALIVTVAVTVVPRWLRDGGTERIVRVRTAAGIVLAVYAVGVSALATAADEPSATGWAVAAVVVVGALVHAVGLLRWYGRGALLLRWIGWLLMMAGAALPSHVSLLLPVGAILAVTLRAPSNARQPA